MRNKHKTKQKKKKAGSSSNARSDVGVASTSANSGDGWREAVDGVILGLNFVKDLSESTDLLNPLKAASGVVIRGLETARAIQRNKIAWREVIEELEEQYQGLQSYMKRIDDKQVMEEAIRPALSAYLRSLSRILDSAQKAKTYSGLGVIRRLARTDIDSGEIQDLIQGTDRAYKRFMEAISTLMVRQITNVAQDIKDMRTEIREQFAELQVSKVHQSETETTNNISETFFKLVYGVDLEVCQKGTRVAILERIRTWARDTETSKRIFWLNDTAGAGKTTIASTMAREWMRDGRLAGRFFFNPNSELASGISNFCHVVAQDIAILLPSLGPVIKKAISSTPSSHFHFEEALHRLIISPLKMHEGTVMFVIDALDNCDAIGRKTILDIMIPTSANVKILITSRPIPDIQDTLNTCEEVEGLDVHLHDPEDANLQADIASYVNKNLQNLSTQQRQEIIVRSHGLFIWASTACRYLKSSRRPADAIRELIDASKGDDIYNLYFQILNQAMVDSDALHHMVDVLRVILAVFEPISMSTMHAFLPSNDHAGFIIKDLRSVLKVDDVAGVIKVIHPTFRNFLSQKEKAGRFFVTFDSAHELMALQCMKLLQDFLVYDLFSFVKPGRVIPNDFYSMESLLKQKLTADIVYASTHWARHVVKALHHDVVLQATHAFISEKLLNWVELMGWRSQVTQCVLALSELNNYAKYQRLDLNPIHDEDVFLQAYQFVQQNQSLVREAPLHTYHSALVFAPENVPLFDSYRRRHDTLATYVMDDPGRHTNATLLVAREGNVFSILFSPDDKRLATLSWSHTVRLWDTTSGADIAGPMKHDNVNYSMPSEMAFSFDSSMLTVGYSCGSVALWDGQTGGIKGLGHKSHGNWVSLLSFFHNNTMMASASPVERNILLWDVSSGSLVHTGGRLVHDKNVSCFSVSFDGNYIASGSGDGIVTLWKVETQEQVCQMHAREALHIRSILYIPPGDMFVTASELGTLQFWEGTSGKSKQLIKAGTSANNANVPISFSLNGQYVASIFDRISLWQKSGGTFVEIELHDAHLVGRIISFSPDSSRLASILDAGRMRIWSTTSGEVMQTVDFAQAHSFSRCAIAHALGKFAAAHGDGIIRLYEIATQGLSNQHSTTFNPAGSLNRIEMSPDKQLLLTASKDCSLQFWGVATGKVVGKQMVGHASMITAMTFSPDSRLIATGSFDGEVRLWVSPTGEMRNLSGSKRESGNVVSVLFSSNGQLLAAGWVQPGQIQIWNTSIQSGQDPVRQVTCSSELMAFAFSHDDELLVSAQGDHVEVHRISDGVTLCSIGHYYADPDQIALSPDGTLIAMLCSRSKVIHLWDIQEEPQPLAVVMYGGIWSNSRLSIHGDGYLVYGSYVWLLESVQSRPQLISGKRLPSTLRKDTRSLIAYRNGWVHSAVVGGRLIAIPKYMGVDEISRWSACGNLIAFATGTGKPLIVDCTPMLQM